MLSSRWPVWEFADRNHITHGVLVAQWKALVLPVPFRRLWCHTLLRSFASTDDLWSARGYAAAATGALYSSFFVSTAHTIRAVLFGRATVTSMRGFLAIICSSHDPAGAPRLLA